MYLPPSRTIRVHSHGSVKELLGCLDDILSEWHFNKIVFSHGTAPFLDNDPRMERDAGGICSARTAFARAWYTGLGTPEKLTTVYKCIGASASTNHQQIQEGELQG